MAIFHLTTKVVSRKQGQCVLASAAYRSGKELTDERTGEVKSYPRRAERVIFEGVFAPQDAPEWARDRQQLWNVVERNETRKDSRLAREIEFALPHEMTDQQREWLVKDYIREQFTRREVVAGVPRQKDWFVAAGLKSGERVVTVGAQSLLSEELRSQTTGTEEEEE